MNETKDITANAVPTIPLPSADLIVYRFDQTDKRLDGLGNKLDKLTTTFVTKEELRDMNSRLDNWQWYWRALVVAALSAIGMAAAALVGKLR